MQAASPRRGEENLRRKKGLTSYEIMNGKRPLHISIMFSMSSTIRTGLLSLVAATAHALAIGIGLLILAPYPPPMRRTSALILWGEE